MFNYTKRDCPQNRDRFGYRLSKSEEPHGPYDVTGEEDDWSYCEKTEDKLRLSDIISLDTARTVRPFDLKASSSIALSSCIALQVDTSRPAGKMFAEAEAKPFYGWMGSLTSPPCTENVQWFLQEQATLPHTHVTCTA